ncbi:malto-oligosyltrehalose trehalohydrolase [Streptantibioticus ferralitis]|uniref:Malto-oligosyltrehalose trehalohydrolase n=1 Tax=Streptantibioticus ferralitis TaxID=236510 RepID=A0ABT5Z4I1_9ACTN|nr:malto-oligosyltrehalose trehalohydrolase [Streptantibioticus ferralitis]MDF2258704.1 malto-oligosyltrehalose trehalohydrolase [Streptantibioticus ferralitis]
MGYEVWAPQARHVAVRVAGEDHPLRSDPARPGWWLADGASAPPYEDGIQYAYVLDGGDPLPDPRSRRQPDGLDGPSAVIDHSRHTWRYPWHGRPLPGAVLYELHIGTFTPEGTFDAAARRLGHLAALGVSHVELMPVCPFPGRHGWGYDGVALWAVHEPYGGPEGLKSFVDTAHAHGLGVVLDVVHNHVGPSGDHLRSFGPYLTDRHQTPWGAAVNLDAPWSDEVRGFLIGSALAWLRDYRLDGLRLDAVHALADTRALPFLEELSAAVDALAAETGQPLFLIAESDLNDPRTTAPREAGGLGLHAQWSDDFHHALHTALTGESQGYYADFARAPLAALAKTLTGVWFHDGTYSSFRGRAHGRPLPGTVPAHRFLGYAQTHDQIGNRATGDRLTVRQLALAAALVLTAPFTPMLFMGEEWGASTPWQFFTDHTDPELAAAVRSGRRREFAAYGWAESRIPDPQDPATRARSCLDWSEPDREPHAGLLRWYRTLIALRTAAPEPAAPDLAATRVSFDEDARWILVRRGTLCTAVNFADQPCALPLSGHRVLAAWSELPDTGGQLVLPAESAAVLREGTPRG